MSRSGRFSSPKVAASFRMARRSSERAILSCDKQVSVKGGFLGTQKTHGKATAPTSSKKPTVWFRYIDYISDNKTERRCFATLLSRQKLRAMNRLRMWLARAARSKRAAKYGLACMAKSLILAHIGTEPLEAGLEYPGRPHRQPPFGPEAEPRVRKQRLRLPGYALLRRHQALPVGNAAVGASRCGGENRRHRG